MTPTITPVRNTLDMLYARTESGLMVPHSALAPTVPQPIAQPHLSRQMRRHLERQGHNNHCRCGRVISWGRPLCQRCENDAQAAVVLLQPATSIDVCGKRDVAGS
jgi:hypothetical protein